MGYKKCRICGESILADSPYVPYQKGYAHEQCYDNYIKGMLDAKLAEQKPDKNRKKTSKAKPKAELKSALSEEEYKDKQKYYDYLRTLVDDEKLTPKIYALSERYIEKYGVSFDDLYKTLVYMNEILQKELTGDVIGIIPFLISEAKEYYAELDRIEQSSTRCNTKDLYKTKTIRIKPQKRKVKQIDMSTV